MVSGGALEESGKIVLQESPAHCESRLQFEFDLSP